MCFFFKQKTAYEMRISDWSSDVCSSDLREAQHRNQRGAREIDAHGIEEAEEGFDRDPDREDAEDQRRGEAGQIADLAGAEAVTRIVAMLFGIAIGERGQAERAGLGERQSVV